MKKRASIFALLLVSALVLLAGCGKSGASGSADKDTFTVGLEAGYAPFNWSQKTDANGAVKIKGSKEYAGGYDVEMAKKLADKMGKELVVVKTEWDGLVPALNSGKIDAIVAGMSPTAERKEAIDFSDNYYKSDLVMVVKKGGKYEGAKSIQDFKGAKVTAQLNTFHYSVIDQIKGVSKETAMDNFPAMRVALQSGIIDGYVSERPEAVSASSANDAFAMVEFEDGFKTKEDDTAVAVGVEKGSDLREAINKALKDISEDERTEIMDQAIKNQPAEQ
ncbi:transporter substrate-binding domain-containing protein [Rossellomorea marisflavi]|uniref:transporter substrate-binding domain-containing protein n=1 Tax=Rossellomorea marisflavi TaxID=189381 RepID=UPI00064FC68A|nr:transporter substrate-binding domain-containing protein [Rossellomorea marisflavi]KMK95685.1 ABC transporter substrate-binding protein [Rossellomorea marisflavi]KML32200.1 ABC transporter substrate-binding protein [Rossellomorea marisflavi]MBV6684698.1 transporter substrate-binding domain-containing protein [Bacillus sp. JRC01]